MNLMEAIVILRGPPNKHGGYKLGPPDLVKAAVGRRRQAQNYNRTEIENLRAVVAFNPGIMSRQLFQAYNENRVMRGLDPLCYSAFWKLLRREHGILAVNVTRGNGMCVSKRWFV